MCDFYNDTCFEECYCKSCFIQVKTNYDILFIKEQAAICIQNCWKNYKLKKKDIYSFSGKCILINYYIKTNYKKNSIVKLKNLVILINYIKKCRKYINKSKRSKRGHYKCGVCGFFPKKQQHICIFRKK